MGSGCKEGKPPVVFRVGNLTVTKSRAFQASRRSTSISADEEMVGSISVRSNGSLIVNNIQGKQSVVNQDRVLLAAVSSNESVTIPSTSLTGPPRVMVIQGDGTGSVVGTSTFLGDSTGTWLVVGFGIAALGVGVGVAVAASDSEGVTCP